MDTQLFDQALIFAAKAHDGQYRKGNNVPYITHPVALAITLISVEAPDSVIIAALLHDVVEDTAVTEAEIEATFGAEVAQLVHAVSEPDRDAPWEERKSHTIEKLRYATLPVKLLACADKLHNIQSMARDYAEQGEAVWGRFNRGREQQAWYYQSLVQSLLSNLPQSEKYPIFAKFQQEVENLFAKA